MTTTPDQFANLIGSARAGDRDALFQLMLEVQHDLGHFVSFKIGNNFRINEEDILQDVFAKSIKEVSKSRAANRIEFLARLKKIATNRIIDVARHQASKKRGGDRKRIESKQDVYSGQAFDLINHLSADGSTPSQFAARNEAIDAMTVAIANLPDDQRKAVRLHFFDKLSLKETAAAMDRSWNSVHGLIQRARQTLRDSMHKSAMWLSKKG